MLEVRVPVINANDEECELDEWLFASGDRVGAGQVIAILETSKAVFELVAETDGILEIARPVGSTCPYGSVVAYLFDSPEERADFRAPQTAGAEELTLTQAARRLVEEHGLSETRLQALGKSVIRSSDVEELLATAPPASLASGPDPSLLSRRQRAIAATVTESHRTIPTAFAQMKVECDSAQRRLEELMQKHSAILGLPEALVKTVADLAPKFPRFYARPDANVGVTFDLGRGLFIAVVRDAGAKTLAEIAEQMMDYRLKAMRDAFTVQDLTGGDITISLSVAADLVCVVPIIVPGQTCMLSLTSEQREWVPKKDGDGGRARTVVSLGLAYDHRVINGWDAGRYLEAVKKGFEAPGWS